ncbi:hypothetical protein Avbf_12919 [Armadillidium vulgare]|nr:hypothetical protein Avbf_12919 [Armadillidium vulgare]
MEPPPNFTVPDVTHLFDSEDSLVWKAGENMVERNTKTNKIECGLVFPLPQSKNKSESVKDNTENVAINTIEPVLENHTPKVEDQNILRRFEMPSTTLGTSITTTSVKNKILETSEQNQFRFSKGYCPELYCSPKPNLSQQRNEHQVLQSNVISNEINKMRSLSYGPNICSVNNYSDGGGKNIKGSNEKCNQATGILHRCECCHDQDLLRNNHRLHFGSLPNSYPPILESPCQSHILKVIEKQNEHILYLQNILEKLLQNSISKHSSESPSPNCNHRFDLDKSSPTMKDVSTQTSDSESLPRTKSTGTNTDHELYGWSVTSNNINNKNNCNRNCCQKNNCNSQALKNYVNVNDPSKKERILTHDNQNEYSTLKSIHNNNLERMSGSPSPKPIHMDMPEYNEDECPVPQDCKYGTCRSEAFTDAPLAGESAMMYNERYMQNQQFAVHPNNDEVVQEENGAYRNRKDHPAVAKMAATDAFYNNNPTLQQLQQFGISFLDPVTLEDKRKPIQRLLVPPYDDLEVISTKKKGRPANRYTADSHLAFIAQNSPAMIHAHREHYVEDTERPAVNGEPYEAFSFATKQFLHRYKLEND